MKTFFEKYAYVATTLINASIAFVRSYLFMHVLNSAQLGYVAIFQSVIIVTGFLQLGIIHGAYRMISFSINRKEKANDAVMSFLMILSLIIFLFLFIYSNIFVMNSFWVFGGIVGILSIWNNWITNLYIALGRTKLLSRVTLVSIIFSLTCIPILYIKPIFGAMLMLSLQPIVFIILSLMFNRDFRFTLMKKNIPYVILLLRYGFVPFLTGILYYVNLQIERAIIGLDLGLIALGEYYLVFVYTSIFLVIPSALAAINFPKTIKIIRANQKERFQFFQVFGTYYIELITYLAVVFILTYWVLPILVNAYLPQHVNGIKYVNVILYGLIVFTLIDPISFLINAKLHYRQLLYIYLFALGISVLSYAYVYYSKIGSLIHYSYINVLFFVAVSLGYITYYFLKGNKGAAA